MAGSAPYSERYENSQRSVKTNLLSRLLDAVKQCQVHFGGKKELATDADSRVSCLVVQLENVFHHGLKVQLTVLSVLKHVTNAVTKLQLDLTSYDKNATVVLWDFVRCYLSEHDMQRFYQLRFINTDPGRGRAWLRSALNEKTLVRYVESFLGTPDILEQFYEPWAFLRDPEHNATLPQVAAGLGTILFAINIDNPDLNSNRVVPDVSQELIIEAKPVPQPIVNLRSGAPNQASKAREKRKKPMVNVISFDDAQRLTDSVGHVHVVQKPMLRSNSEGVRNLLREWSVSSDTKAHSGSMRSATHDDDSFSLSSADDKQLSPDVRSSVDVPSDPVVTNSFSDLLLSNQRHYSHVIDDSTLGSIDDTIENHNMLQEEPDFSHTLLRSLDDNVEQDMAPVINHMPSRTESQTDSVFGDETTVEERSGSESALRKQLDVQSEEIVGLRVEIACLKMRHQESLRALESQIVERDNDNQQLRAQLKNYIAAIQLLKAERPTTTASAQPSADDTAETTDFDQAAMYEEKLVQLAQMHAELMEFNDNLQAQLQRKNHLIRRMRGELVDLRGPVMDDLCNVDDGVFPRAAAVEFSPIQERPAVNLWIPTAFMTGKGTDVHHVYQIYLRIRETEWNVYRRYNELRDLHVALARRDPKLNVLCAFPPKKSMGHKDKKFVEQRRKELEQCLRVALNYVVQNFPEFVAVPVCKDTVINVVPLLSDVPRPPDKRKNSQQRR